MGLETGGVKKFERETKNHHHPGPDSRLRHGGGVAAVGPHGQLPGVVHPQQQYYPSQPLYPQDIPPQEVPNGHDACPTEPTTTSTIIIIIIIIQQQQHSSQTRAPIRASETRSGGGVLLMEPVKYHRFQKKSMRDQYPWLRVQASIQIIPFRTSTHRVQYAQHLSR
ncbi:hypothetical protein F2P81_017549 [Scophthalmus maximus]|uniref:Uncharacterized protein n=1 Tax=Scophthalmus maximus TaxID=52904 RepID=A0A6A4SF15_SCOMX|nr:hypothetical protein F2P81_017549 [Scophthalmus maximus]